MGFRSTRALAAVLLLLMAEPAFPKGTLTQTLDIRNFCAAVESQVLELEPWHDLMM